MQQSLTGEHQEDGRVDRPRGEDNLLAGKDLMADAEAVEDDANCLPVLVEEELRDEGVHQDVQVGAALGLPEEGLRRRAASAATSGRLGNGEAVLVRPVYVNIWIACFQK